MSNKKSRKMINIMLSALMLLGGNSAKSFAADATPNYGKNGVAYVLLSSDFSNPGVYRFNDYDGSTKEPWKLFKTNTITGKVSGLAANQYNEVFLLSAIEGANFQDAPIGWLPTGIKFDENSSIYLAVAGPSDGGANEYWRDGYPYWHAWPSDGDSSSGDYWKRDQTYGNKTYEYAVQFGGPDGVKYLNGKDGDRGCPIWDGSYKPSSSNVAAIKHPSDSRKVILPSHVGALSYFLYGTKNEPAIEGLPMDGTNGRDRYTFDQANGAGVFEGDSSHGYGTMFGCIVRRFYEKRENTLNLYSGRDNTAENNYPIEGSLSQTQANVLKTVDVKVREAYGKLCGDNCIDGGEIPGGDVETALSTVTVVTATTGNRYGFNPLGVFKGSNSTDASLRVVKTNGTTNTIDIADDNDGLVFSDNITNQSYLNSKGVTPASIKTIGVSSKFGSSNGLDYIYGSGADYFVVQDSWWGKGGIAYEYYKGTDGNPGTVVKIDYVNKDNQTESEELGDLEGNVDSIGIDGDGYLYALKTEESPSDSDMENISITPSPSLTSVDIDGTDYTITYSGWRRDKQNTTDDDETINEGYESIPNGQEQPGDYRLAEVKQDIYKSVKRYPQATGALGAEEDRGSMWAGYDTWTNKLKKTSSGYTWDYPLWRQNEGTRSSAIHAELAVVNVADSPIEVPGTEKHYLTTTGGTNGNGESFDYKNGNDQIIGEQYSLTLKVEGYKPVVGNVQRDLKDIGDVTISGGVELKGVKLNTIPAADGTYHHDEDFDNKKSGFPSSMFEAKGKYTTVTWKIAQVEDTTAVKLSEAKIIKTYPDKITTSDTNSPNYKQYNEMNFDFLEPGRYIVQAEVTYNYFSNFGVSGIRPDSLTCATANFTTEPKLIQVYANDLHLNQTPSYITNIELKFDNNKNDVTGDSGSDYDLVEGSGKNTDLTIKKERKFGSLKIEFDAQFFKEVNSNTSNNLDTYDGIGVWDYNYYKNLYTIAKNNNIGVDPDKIFVSPSLGSAYNLKAYDSSNPNPSSDFKEDVYNPGKFIARQSSGASDYTAGTKVNGKPSKTDLSFIQYALYLRKFKSSTEIPNIPQNDVSNDSKPFDRGELIYRGTFAECLDNEDNFKEIAGSDRKYHVSLTVNDIDSLIDVPRDPKDYTIDMEIIYPRVTWLNNGLGVDDGNNYFSSIVPAGPETSPIHLISMLTAESSPGVTQSYTIENGTLFENEPYFTVCARDKELPTTNLPTNDKEVAENFGLPRIETTGDPSSSITINYEIKDNNPFLSSEKKDKSSITAMTQSEADSVSDLVMQTLIDDTSFDNSNVNKKYTFKKDGIEKKPVSIELTNVSDTFFKDEDFRIKLSHEFEIATLSFDTFRPEIVDDKLMKASGSLSLENWVGELDFSVVGHVYDGLGTDSTDLVHHIYNSKDIYTNIKANITDNDVLNYPYLQYYRDLSETIINTMNNSNECISAPSQPYLKRIDNDPPSIEVELVSQSDNRRWNYQLIEGINDKRASSEPTKIELSESTLVVKEFTLKDSSTDILPSPVEEKIKGTTAYTDNVANYDSSNPENTIGTTTVDLRDLKNIPYPSFRRAGRLLINVNVFDNCGFLKLGDETWIKVEDAKYGKTLLEKTYIDTSASHNFSGIRNKFLDKPRGVFFVNLPLQVFDGQDGDPSNSQIIITVHVQDNSGSDYNVGNERELIIPVKLVESSFETRVLETKEERR